MTPRTMKIDPAVIKLLGLNPNDTNVSSVGGGGFASTSKIISHRDDGTEEAYFMKTGSGQEAEVMFEGTNTALYMLSQQLKG
jgi:protein-ribulosamine 3-kinase